MSRIGGISMECIFENAKFNRRVECKVEWSWSCIDFYEDDFLYFEIRVNEDMFSLPKSRREKRIYLQIKDDFLEYGVKEMQMNFLERSLTNRMGRCHVAHELSVFFKNGLIHQRITNFILLTDSVVFQLNDLKIVLAQGDAYPLSYLNETPIPDLIEHMGFSLEKEVRFLYGSDGRCDGYYIFKDDMGTDYYLSNKVVSFIVKKMLENSEQTNWTDIIHLDRSDKVWIFKRKLSGLEVGLEDVLEDGTISVSTFDMNNEVLEKIF